MPEYELKTAILKVRDNKRFNFALYKGDKDNQVLITPKPASKKQEEALEKECGPVKRIAKGLVFLENGQLVFATKAAPSPSWETMLTKILKDHQCAKYLPISLRQLGENESDEAVEEDEGHEQEGQEQPESNVPPSTNEAHQPSEADNELWEKALETIEERYLLALRGLPANGDKMRAVMALATGKAEAGEMPAALQALKALQGLIAEAESGAVGKETDVIPGGIVEERRTQLTAARQRWEGAIAAAGVEIGKVQTGIAEDDIEASLALEGILNGYHDKLVKVLDAAAKAHTDENATKAVEAVRTVAANLQKEIAADPVLNYLENFPLGPVVIQNTFNEAFADVDRLLNA